MPFAYPILLELADRRCVVIGALPVREGKVEGLLAGGATDVVLVASEPAERLDDLEGLDGVVVNRRTWYAADLTGAFLVIAHDPDPAVRARIAEAARAAGALVNVVDDIPGCDWAAPAVVRRGELLIAIGTGGASPEILRVLREVREETSPLLPDLRTRSRRWAEALDPDEAAELVRGGEVEELRARLRARLLDGAEAT